MKPLLWGTPDPRGATLWRGSGCHIFIICLGRLITAIVKTVELPPDPTVGAPVPNPT
jgi:hypothetical protein